MNISNSDLMMLEETKTLQDYLRILKRYRNKIFIIALAIFALAGLVALKWPPVYKSTATILIERQEIPAELVRSTITSFADQRIQVISQRVMTSENIKAIIDKFNLYADERKTSTLETLFENFREDVNLKMISADVVDPRSGTPTQATIAFSLAFNSVSPQLAQQVANELVSLYLNENLKRRTLAASEATNFLAFEAEKLRNHISEVESELAKFKETNANALPELQNLNLQMLDRTEQDITEVDRKIIALNEQKLYLEAELAQIQPNMATFTANGERVYGASDRLKALQAEFVAISARYSPTHPDVLKMQREIIALEKEVGGGVDKQEILAQLTGKKGELAALSERYSAEHPDRIKLNKAIEGLQRSLKSAEPNAKDFGAKPDNPAYIQLQAQLQSTNTELNAIKTTKVKLTEKISDLEKNIRLSPQVERKYSNLMRDYENTTLKYREVKAKQMEADMSQAMEKDSKGEHFSLIEPPLFPEKPVKPNRAAIVSLGFVLALGLAVGFALISANLDTNIYSIKEIQNITGLMPLVQIPYIENREDIIKKSATRKKLLFSFFGLFILIALLVHFLIMPLDVLWFVLARKLG